MLKFTGAVCVLAGVILFCLTRWREQARRREILSDLSAGFYRLSDEIRATRKPLGILLARLAADSGPDAAEFFQIVSGAADAGENNNNFPAVWRDASENLLSEPRDRKRLIEISGDLRGDEEQIRRALSAAGGYFSKRLAELEESARDDNRKIAALALSGGALLIILLY